MPTKERRRQRPPVESVETLDAVQKPALDVLRSVATAQAEVVQELLLGQIEALGSELGVLLLEAAERSPQIINAFADGLTQVFSSVEPVLTGPLGKSRAAPLQSRQEPQPMAVPDGALSEPAVQPQELTGSQLLNAILLAIAEGYLAGQPGDIVSRSIHVRYPGAVPTMQKYLAMNDGLVLMWMRQQPAIAKIANDKRFAEFYAELKAGVMRYKD